MISVLEAEKIILAEAKDLGTENVPFDLSVGRILAEDIKADRDLPPFDRVTMDGIAIRYSGFERGIRTFLIKGVQAAGDDPIFLEQESECVEIMTGAALPPFADTVIRYEDIRKDGASAFVLVEDVNPGQNIHYKGKDKREREVLIAAPQRISPPLIHILATVGKTEIAVKRLPRVMIISTGDELVDIHDQPSPFQIRSSNKYAIKAALQQQGITAGTMHLPDHPGILGEKVKEVLDQYDILILSGGISMGKFDYVPEVLNSLSVQKLFHKVQQRPGKPFWFGKAREGALVFAFPGNPVSSFLCLYRYFIPWLNASLGLKQEGQIYASLGQDFDFSASLTYFLQVQLKINEEGQLVALPLEGHGSGDFANLANSQAFMELPSGVNHFKKGERYRIWSYKPII